MAIISDKFSYLYLVAPGAASTTVSSYLNKHCDGSWLPKKDVLNGDGHYLVRKKHTTIPELIEGQLLTSEVLDTLFKFTTVRNPFDRVFSQWHRSRVKWSKELEDSESWIYKAPGKAKSIQDTLEYDFSDWVKLRFGKFYKQGVKKHLYADYIDGVDCVIKSENLDVELKGFLEKIGVDSSIEIASKNITPKKDKPYWQYYSREARDIVTSIFEPDIIKFGYSF